MLKNVIITGGTGFIGRWMIKELLNNGINVTAIVRDKARLCQEYLKDNRFDYIEGDISTIPAAAFHNAPYDTFYHLAWAGVASQFKNDFGLQMHNIEISIQAAALSHKLGCRKFIAAGTVAEYVFRKDIIDVEGKQTPNDMYGAAKTSTHYFLHVYTHQLHQPLIWAVLPSTFGEYREDNNIITYTIKTLLRGEKPSYGSLTQMWDFLYVSEVVRALRFLGEFGHAGITYGIGSGIYRPLRDYIISIRDMIDPSLPLGINERPEMTQQTLSSCVNIFRLSRDTGFYPKITFEEGIRRTIKYWEQKIVT